MKTVVSILFGLIIGILFYKVLLSNMLQSYKHHGPNSNEIIKNIYQTGDKYFQFQPQICPCPI